MCVSVGIPRRSHSGNHWSFTPQQTDPESRQPELAFWPHRSVSGWLNLSYCSVQPVSSAGEEDRVVPGSCGWREDRPSNRKLSGSLPARHVPGLWVRLVTSLFLLRSLLLSNISEHFSSHRPLAPLPSWVPSSKKTSVFKIIFHDCNDIKTTLYIKSLSLLYQFRVFLSFRF